MPTSSELALQQRCQQIVTSPVLSPEQKRHFLALEAENALPYPQLPAQARQALNDGVICDMYEGHAPFKPRYVLPDYARFLANGSSWLELEGAKDLDDALSLLTILYHHVPSVTSMPVYLGQLDALLQPYVRILTQDEIDIRIKRFWRYLDRTLPDAFMHANIGPADTPITRAILRADAELKQVSPNLTFIYDPQITLAICCSTWRKIFVNAVNRIFLTALKMIKFSQKAIMGLSVVTTHCRWLAAEVRWSG